MHFIVMAAADEDRRGIFGKADEAAADAAALGTISATGGGNSRNTRRRNMRRRMAAGGKAKLRAKAGARQISPVETRSPAGLHCSSSCGRHSPGRFS